MCPKTMPKLCDGSSSPLDRATPLPRTTSGSCTAQGRGVPENDAEAVRWFRLAAERGFDRAQHNLGLMYANGDGVPQDDVLAYAWLNLAVAQGNALASVNRDQLRTRMTANQVVRAQELSAILFDRIF